MFEVVVHPIQKYPTQHAFWVNLGISHSRNYWQQTILIPCFLYLDLDQTKNDFHCPSQAQA